MKKKLSFIILLFAIALPFSGYSSENSSTNPSSPQPVTTPEKKPLYWIDPMEPKIHYSAPGKSRMGMKLVPVYPEQQPTPNQANAPVTP